MEKRHRIVIHGLVSHHGMLRAKLCVRYLRKYLRRIYEKPIVKTYYDVEWVEFVNKIRAEMGDKFRRLYYLKNPIIVFLDDQYIGDHRALIQHVTYEHGIIPDLPYPDVFPDFTKFLPKRPKKGYVYLDLRVGDLSDYIVGKMVFELHKDVVPQTSEFFSGLCRPFGPSKFHEAGREERVSYLGSTIRRVVKGSFIQGGAMEGPGARMRVPDENFTLKHDGRGVLSLANAGGNRSTTEFVIGLRANPWLDGINVVFGRLIFGEALLEAVEEVPTYYQSPLRDVVIVGCGVIPEENLRHLADYEANIVKIKAKNTEMVEKTRKKNMQKLREFEKEVSDLLKQSERERLVQFTFSDLSDSTSYGSDFLATEHTEDETFASEENDEFREGEMVEFEGEEDIMLEDSLKMMHLKIQKDKHTALFRKNDPTLEKVILKVQKKDKKIKLKMMNEFVMSILKKVFILGKSDEDSTQLEDFQISDTKDVIDIRDKPSGIFLDSFFEKGYYSLPLSLRKTLMDAFNNLKPSKLKLLGIEARSMLELAGVSGESLHIYSSEDMISGIVMAVIRVGTFAEGQYNAISLSASTVIDIIGEVCEDAVEAIRLRGQQFVREAMANKDSLGSFDFWKDYNTGHDEGGIDKNDVGEEYIEEDIIDEGIEGSNHKIGTEEKSIEAQNNEEETLEENITEGTTHWSIGEHREGNIKEEAIEEIENE